MLNAQCAKTPSGTTTLAFLIVRLTPRSCKMQSADALAAYVSLLLFVLDDNFHFRRGHTCAKNDNDL